MADPTLKTVFYAAMERIQKLKASEVDLALVFLMGEFITDVGGSEAMSRLVDQIEAKWKIAQGEYARGKV